MSALHQPLLDMPAEDVLQGHLCRRIPALLKSKESSLKASSAAVLGDRDLDEISDIPSLILTKDSPIVSILAHNDNTLTYGTSSGAIAHISPYLSTIHTYESSLPDALIKLHQPVNDSYILAQLNASHLIIYKSRAKHIIDGLSNAVVSVAVSNEIIAAADSTFEIFVWNAEDLELVRKYTGHSKGVLSLYCFRSGNVMSSSSDQTIRIWSDGEVVLRGHTAEIQAAIGSKNEKYVLSGGNDNTVRIWEIQSSKLIATLRGHQDNVTQLKLINKDLFVSAGDLSLIVWSLVNRARVSILRGHTCSPTSISISSDYIYSGSAESEIRIWDINHLLEVGVIEGHSKGIRALALSKGKLFSGSDDNTLRCFRVQTSGVIETLADHDEWVLGVAISADNTFILTGGGDKVICVYERFKLVNKLEGHTGWISRLEFIKNDTQFISCSFDRTLKIWDFESRTCLITKSGHTGAIYYLCVKPEYIITGSFDSTLRIWDYSDSQTSKECKGHSGMILGMATANTYDEVISVSRDKTIRFWNAHSAHELDCIQLDAYAICVTVSKTDRFFVTGSYDKVIRVWDYRRKELTGIIEGHTEKIDAVRITENERILLSGSSDFSIKIWNLSDLSCICTYPLHSDRVRDIVLSKDERFILTSSTDHTVKVLKYFNKPDRDLVLQCIPNQWMGLYAFLRAKSPEKWMRHVFIDPFNVNLLHLYAYDNKHAFMEKGLSYGFPFITANDGVNPLSIAINRSATQTIEVIIKYLVELSTKEPSKFVNYVKIIEKQIPELISFNLPVISEFLDKLIVKDEILPSIGTPLRKLPIIVKSDTFYLNKKSFIHEEEEQKVSDIVFEKVVAKLNLEAGSRSSLTILKHIIDNPKYSQTKFAKVLSELKYNEFWYYSILSVFFILLTSVLCITYLEKLWYIVLVLVILSFIKEAIEIFGGFCSYLMEFDNISELVRIGVTAWACLAIGTGNADWKLTEAAIFVNIIKFFAIAKYFCCLRAYYINGLRLFMASTIAAITVFLLKAMLDCCNITYDDLILSTLLAGGFIALILTLGNRFLTWDPNTEPLSSLKLIQRREKRLIFNRSHYHTRYIHLCRDFKTSN